MGGLPPTLRVTRAVKGRHAPENGGAQRLHKRHEGAPIPGDPHSLLCGVGIEPRRAAATKWRTGPRDPHDSSSLASAESCGTGPGRHGGAPRAAPPPKSTIGRCRRGGEWRGLPPPKGGGDLEKRREWRDKPVAMQGCPEMSDFSSVIAPLATPPKRVARGGVWGKETATGEATNRSFIGGGFVPQALPAKGSKSRGFILGVSAANGTSERHCAAKKSIGR